MTETAAVQAIVPPAGLAFRKFRDRIVESGLLAAALVAVFTTLAIVIVLVTESLPFFSHVSIKDFLTDTMWTPLFAEARYGILPLVAGTLVTTLVALAVAIPCGTSARLPESSPAPSPSSRLELRAKPLPTPAHHGAGGEAPPTMPSPP